MGWAQLGAEELFPSEVTNERGKVVQVSPLELVWVIRVEQIPDFHSNFGSMIDGYRDRDGESGASFCTQCATALAPEHIFCSKCGARRNGEVR